MNTADLVQIRKKPLIIPQNSDQLAFHNSAHIYKTAHPVSLLEASFQVFTSIDKQHIAGRFPWEASQEELGVSLCSLTGFLPWTVI